MARFLSPPRVFLVTAISNLARSCTLVMKSETDQESSFALDQLCFVPSKEEIELLQSFTNQRWWQREFCNLARNAVAVMFAHLSVNNREYSMDYINALVARLSAESTSDFKLFERSLLRLS